MMRAIAIAALLGLAGLGCEEVYTECRPERAPSDFPPGGDLMSRPAQCDFVCLHLASLGCHLGCPYLPDGGLDAGVQTTDLSCYDSCIWAVDTMSNEQPNASEEAITHTLQCYAGAETCRQFAACSRLCGDDGGQVWPDDMQCGAE
jgi:hypothetical protein